MISLNEIMPGVLCEILSFLEAPELAAVSETTKEMCGFVRVNDNLWQSFVPTFPCHNLWQSFVPASPWPRGGPIVQIPEEWVDPRHMNGFENLNVFYQAKQLQEYKNKVVTAFHTRRMRILEGNPNWMTTYLGSIEDGNDSNAYRLCATQRQELYTRLTIENLLNSIIKVSIQTFENEGMSWDCLVGIVNEWFLTQTSEGFYDAVYSALTGLPAW